MILANTHGIWNSGGWSPIELPGLELWTRNSELVDPTPGAFVWGDKSGNGNDLLQIGVTNPVGVAAALNGLDIVRFPSGAKLASTIAALSNPTCWIVWKRNDAVSNIDPVNLAGNVVQNTSPTLAPPFGQIRYVGGTISAFSASSIDLESYVLSRFDLDAGAGHTQHNKEVVSSTAFTPNTTTDFFLGKGSGNSLIDVAEVVIINGHPSADSILKMQNYVINRYAIIM